MNLDKLLSKIFGIKKQKFEFTQKEKDILSQEKSIPHETSAMNVDDAFNMDSDQIAGNKRAAFEELIIEIYEEAKLKSDLETYNLWAEDFDSLECYKILIVKPRQEQKEFILFLLNRIVDQERNLKKIPNRFKSEIINRLLRFLLSFSEDEIQFLINFCIRDDSKFGHLISLKLIINQLKTYAPRQQFSKSFLRFLKSFLTSRALTSTAFESYTNQITILQRIIQNNSGIYKNNGEPLYLLISDHFGGFVNKKILELEVDQKEGLSEIAHKFSNYSNTNSPESYFNIIKFLIPTVRLKELEIYCKIFVERAVFFKPKVRSVYARTDYRGNFYYYKYQPISKENLMVLRGFVFLVAHFKLETCLHLFHKLIERSYSKTNGVALGNGHKLVGEPSIHILMHYFENKGRKILLELYHDTKFKSIKSQIKKEAAKLKEEKLFWLSP
ncbi:hypothetical protein D1818_18410 [Aquimarina sp. BL5]|uniref:hypothetical protein n=1 Tax=Aquimarina sp. BL5 TaxID=1714860 RepID=UPI000E51C77E|nr:hypothetical protein [Aquimarina sp. BL5]AXT52700.1 hypothetical protein D1818_18410 [Aquimarina sp. BL5]RKN08285.1 hypothetical protein D7036_06020 [Aquimarina sp. BL5]